MTDEQASDWECKMICCLGISTSNSDINVVALHKTVKELYEQGRADEREAQVCCGDYEKCIKACTPRGRWLAEKELTKSEPKSISTNDHLCAMLRQVHDVLACTALPMKREWVGLTDEEINDFDKKLRDNGDYCSLHFAWGISAKLKEKNNGSV